MINLNLKQLFRQTKYHNYCRFRLPWQPPRLFFPLLILGGLLLLIIVFVHRLPSPPQSLYPHEHPDANHHFTTANDCLGNEFSSF